MRRLLFFALPLALFGCTQPPPLGDVQRKAFEAQAQAGQRPDGASHLTAEEVRTILGTSPTGNTNNAAKTTGNGPQSKTPLIPSTTNQ